MLFDIHSCFIPECYLDTNLVEFLLGSPSSVNHTKGNGTVVAKMKDKFADSFAVGILDDDKRKLREIEGCDKIERLWRNGLKFFRHKCKQHYFILISPAIEKWILNESEKAEINLSKYELPVNIKEMKSIKGFTQRNDTKFKKLFHDMLLNEKCDEIMELKRWLLFLKENNYNTNIDLL